MSRIDKYERNAPWWSVVMVFLAALTLSGASFYLNSQQRQGTERKFCQVVAQSTATEKGKLDRYLTDPPTTEAGRAQKAELEISYSNYLDLKRALGCPRTQGD